MIKFEQVNAYHLTNKEGKQETWVCASEWRGLMELDNGKGESMIVHKPGFTYKALVTGQADGELTAITMSPSAAERFGLL